MNHLHVNQSDGHDPSAIESQLGRMTMMHPPRHLRQRVLAAVDAVLAEPPADVVIAEAQWSLLATAAAAVLLVASWGGSLGLSQSVADAVPPQPVSLTERMASTGIQIESFSQP